MTRQFWTDEERAKLAQLYPDLPTAEIEQIMGKTKHAIYYQANKMGLKKSEAFYAAGHGGRVSKGTTIGRDFQFEKGHNPWNKGTKGLCLGGEKTWFMKGQQAFNKKPLGAERLTKDGYLQRKMTETGYPPHDWVEVHRLLWEEHHGPIPEGHVIIFKDGNKKNICIENLEMLTLAENVKRNSIHRYPPQVKTAIRALGKFKQRIKKHEQQNHC